MSAPNDYLHREVTTAPRAPYGSGHLKTYWKTDGKQYVVDENGAAVVIADQAKSVNNVPANDFATFSIAATAATGGATTSTVTVTMKRPDGTDFEKSGARLRARICNDGTWATATNATIAVGTGCTLTETHTSNKDITATNVATNSATGTLTFTGVVVDGETVTTGSRIYQFRTGATALTSGNVDVDISARGTKAQGTLTIAEPVTAGDTIVIGDQTYVFVTGSANAPGEIGIGADEAATKVNIPAAINGTDGFNTANAKVTASAFDADVCTLTARYTGTQGNSIPTVELGQGLTHASNVFDATTLGTATAGVDPSAAHAIIDLVAAITGDSSAVVTAVDGAGDTMVVTASTSGSAGNSIASTETCANASWGGATLSGGSDGAEDTFIFVVTNASDETVTFRIDRPFGANVHGDFSAEADITFSA